MSDNELNDIYKNLPMCVKYTLDEFKSEYADIVECGCGIHRQFEKRQFIKGYIQALCDLSILSYSDGDKLQTHMTL